MSTLADSLEAQLARLQNEPLRKALDAALAATPRECRLAPSRWPTDSTVKPSPLPWVLVDNDAEIWDAEEHSIACVGDERRSIWADLQAAINGRLIVEAVNGWHDVAALKARVAELEGA